MIQKVTVNDVVVNLKMQVLLGSEYLSNEVTKSMTSRPGVEIYSDYITVMELHFIVVEFRIYRILIYWLVSIQFSAVQLLSCVRLFVTP